jgi:hypothetical protein
MSDTLDQRGFAMPQAFGSSSHFQRKGWQVLNTKVFEFASLEQIPPPFLWIQFWRVSRQTLQMNALGTSRAQKVFDDMRAMNGSASQITSSLPGLLRESICKKRTTSGPLYEWSWNRMNIRPSGVRPPMADR